jgi:hypothetical protein
MGFHFGVSGWQGDVLEAVRSFAARHGKRSDGPLDDAWWSAAADPHTLALRGAGGSYAGAPALAQALSAVGDTWLWMAEWKAAGRRIPERLMVVPFGFWREDAVPPAVAALDVDGAQLVITESVRLLDHWPGHHDEDHASRSAQAMERVLSDPSAEHEDLTIGVERWLYELARTAWDARLPLTIAY